MQIIPIPMIPVPIIGTIQCVCACALHYDMLAVSLVKVEVEEPPFLNIVFRINANVSGQNQEQGNEYPEDRPVLLAGWCLFVHG